MNAPSFRFYKTQSLQQKMQASAKLLQSVQVLRMPYMHLYDSLKEALEENPFLKSKNKDFWEKKVQEKTLSGNSWKKDGASVHDVISQTAHSKPSVFSNLQQQLSLVFPKSSQEYEIGLHIISALDNKGFFPEEKRNNLFKQFSVSKEKLKKIIQTINRFEPMGLACSNVEDFLCLQLTLMEENEGKNYDWLKHVIANELQTLGSPHAVKILQEKTKKTKEEIESAIKTIASLSPFPQHLGENNNSYVVPEVVFYLKGKTVRAKLEEDLYPTLSVDETLLEKVIEQASKKIDNFSKEKISTAKAMVAAIEYRKTSLKKVVDIILREQKNYFIYGNSALRPLTITKVALELSLNKSTISRLVNAKYAETPFGVMPLKKFFTNAYVRYASSHHHLPSAMKTKEKLRLTGNKHRVEKASRALVMREIEKIKQLTPRKHLSDERICRILNARGYQISRRTVNKYRHLMKAQNGE